MGTVTALRPERSSFEMLHPPARRLPMMICPHWIDTRSHAALEAS